MENALHIVSLLLVSFAMALSLAHALELPGKMRLDKDAYMTVQQIYYPGFTAGGFSEVAALVTLVALLSLQPYGTAQFWWSAAALALLAAVHAIYWIFTHPVNNFWLKDVKLSGFGNSFFSRFAGTGREDEWKRLRDVWEYSHVARAILAILSLVAITVSLSI